MKRVPIVIFLTALITGLFLCLTTCQPPSVKKPDKTIVKAAKKEISVLNKNYQKEKALLEFHADSLQKELDQATKKLGITKRKLEQSQSKLLALAHDTSNLSSERQENCDSLREEVIQYTALVDSAQSQYESKLTGLQEMVATKESETYICNLAYDSLRSISEQNLERERQLTKDLQTAFKVQRRKTIQNKLLAGGLLILSGITTTLYINTTLK